ncbi:hypothetical protein QW131_07305 [Roseibium salinum]|nr:hypothetical protein [Roseibium salinum]
MTATDQTADIKTVMQLSDELTTWLLEKGPSGVVDGGCKPQGG